MLIIKGVNVFPSQIEAVLINEGYSVNYLIEVDRVGTTDTFDVYVEFLSDEFDDAVKNVAEKEKKLQNAIKNMTGIVPRVHLQAPQTITRSEGKAVRVIDRRKLV